MPARETSDVCGEAPASSSSPSSSAPSSSSPPVANKPGGVECAAAGPESEKEGGAGGSMTAGGKALIHPQRHNLKNRFELMKTLGEGTYGKVKLASEKATGEQVAIKYVKKTKIQDEMDLNRIRREIRILTSLRHPHIVNIRQVFEKKDRIVLVMDYAEGGELYDYLNSQRCLPEVETRRIFRQIVAAVHYVHQNGIVHRDLKLENIILDTDRNVKIADFGLANYFSKNSSLNTFCGSPLYASPEIVNGQPYKGPEVDVWSLGVVLYTLAYGAMPFESGNLKVLRQQISTGQYAEPAQPCGASGLIRHMLTVNSARRATMPEVLNHWWVNLGFDLTPDGRQQNLMSLPLNRSSHRQLGAGSPSGSDAEAEVKPPPASLRHVPGARSSRRTAESSLVRDDEVLLQEKGPCVASGVTGQDSVDAGQNSGDVFLRGDDSVCHESEACQRSARGDQAGTGSCHAEAGDNPNLPWSQVLANSIREIRDRVIQSLASEEEAASLETLAMEQAEAEAAHSMDKVRSTPNLRQVEEEALAASGDKRHSLDSDKAFDSDRKPRRGILKRKGKFSGDDYSCCMMMNDRGTWPKNIKSAPKNNARPRDLPLGENFFCHPAMPNVSAQSLAKSPAKPALVPSPAPATALTVPKQQACPVHHCHSTPTSTATTPNSLDGAEKWACPPPVRDDPPKTHPAPADLTFPDIPPAGEGGSTSSPSSTSLTSQSPSGSDLGCCTCSTDVTKVVRRRKGILKNGGSSNRNSLIDDARKRLSMGSQSSNSSADILDLSYDSGDGEQLVCKSRSLDRQEDLICRSQSSDSQDLLLCRPRSAAACHHAVCKSRSTDGEDMLRQPPSTDHHLASTNKSRCDDASSSSVKPQCGEARDAVHPPLPSTASDHTICKSQSVEENVVHRFRSSDLQKALSELSMSCSRSKRYQHSYSFQPGDRGSFSLEGEFTALNLADMSAALLPHSSALCDDAMFDYSEARHVLQQALQFAN